MIVGFTGTQIGLSAAQKHTLRYVALPHCQPHEFHHGDCIGADAEAHELVREFFSANIVKHPPENPSKRAYCLGGFLVEHKPYLVRNRDIVDVSDVLIATPKGAEELRSGTWSTVRYARKKHKPVLIVWPGGQWTWEQNNA